VGRVKPRSRSLRPSVDDVDRSPRRPALLRTLRVPAARGRRSTRVHAPRHHAMHENPPPTQRNTVAMVIATMACDGIRLPLAWSSTPPKLTPSSLPAPPRLRSGSCVGALVGLRVTDAAGCWEGGRGTVEGSCVGTWLGARVGTTVGTCVGTFVVFGATHTAGRSRPRNPARTPRRDGMGGLIVSRPACAGAIGDDDDA
jgi:hypothetical protein